MGSCDAVDALTDRDGDVYYTYLTLVDASHFLFVDLWFQIMITYAHCTQRKCTVNKSIYLVINLE